MVDQTLEVPPYQQIVEQVRALIERGDLEPNALLPTVRQLAGDLGVAPNTVARAYAELQDDGWTVSEGRRGTRVRFQTPAVDPRARSRTLQQTVQRFIDGLTHRGFTPGEIKSMVERSVKVRV
jgi:GntR family transcriptional regulator